MAAGIVLLYRGDLALEPAVGLRTKAGMIIGVLILLAGGLYDFWWHNAYGFADSTPWTPSHMTATAGFVILLTTGSVGLSKGSSSFVKIALSLSLVLFVALWAMVLALT